MQRHDFMHHSLLLWFSLQTKKKSREEEEATNFNLQISEGTLPAPRFSMKTTQFPNSNSSGLCGKTPACLRRPFRAKTTLKKVQTSCKPRFTYTLAQNCGFQEVTAGVIVSSVEKRDTARVFGVSCWRFL